MYGDGTEGAAGLRNLLLLAYELLDAQGRPNRYEPAKAIFPLERLFGTVLGQVTGTYTACRLALEGERIPGEGEPGFCFFLGGGMHHARYDQGVGFCLVNDSIIAAGRLQAEKRAARIWILDVDAHKGDGSAELAARMRQPLPERRGEPLESGAPAATGIFTLSTHMASGWPLDPESLRAAPRDRAPWVPSDVDVPIESGEEADYVPRLAAGIEEMERRFGKPDFAIVVDGADPYERDGLPSTASLALSLEQCLDRDKLLHGYLREKHIPSAWLMAGGYGEHAWEPPAYFLKGL
jgi:acetoin utilization deacetylase AcuC-like enzyme